jgi:hypothetical protein
MSFSLRIEHGDLALNGTELGKVEGADKLQQDLAVAILTPLGFEELHPLFGSILVENLIDNGIVDILGTNNFRRAATLVNAELRRLCRNYQEQQLKRNENDAIRFGRYTLTPNEILVSVKNIVFKQAEDHLICELQLEIGTETVSIPVPIPNS